MPVLGKPKSFHTKFKFLVEIDGFTSAKFQKSGSLEAEIAKIEYSEGGDIAPDKIPGRLSFSDVQLERGATDDREAYTWFKETADAAANSGLKSPEYEKNADVIQLDRNQDELRRWGLNRSWPTKFVAGEWDNEADEVVIEMLTLTYKFFELI